MLSYLFRSILGVALLPLVAAVASAMLLFLRTTAEGWVGSPFMWGFLAFIPFGLILLFAGASFVQILEHELGHYILARLLGWNVEELKVNRDKGGEVTASGGVLKHMVSLAPYFLPVFTVPLVLIRPFTTQPFQSVVELLIGITLAWHYFSVVAEVRVGQPDVTDSGPLFWLPFTLLFNAGILVLIIGVLTEDVSAIGVFIGDSLEIARETYAVALGWLESLIQRIR